MNHGLRTCPVHQSSAVATRRSWTPSEVPAWSQDTPAGAAARTVGAPRRSVWIDLDNSPHVPFFVPIIEELSRLGYSVTLTVRDAYQVRELAELHALRYRCIGRHYGKNKALKVLGTAIRSCQLAAAIRGTRPAIAVSHGSRSQVLAAGLLRVPSVIINDYEFSAGPLLIRPHAVIAPNVIPAAAFRHMSNHVLGYRGIKEDVYVPGFTPDASIVERLDLRPSDVVVTARPPASEAHYHNPESDTLFAAAIEHLKGLALVKLIVVPRNARQAAVIRDSWHDALNTRRMILLERPEHGLNLIWHSDLVISGGGTMNREAAALGVPVYSVFRGRIGAVDQYLAAEGRLMIVETPDDIPARILAQQRCRCSPLTRRSEALRDIVGHLATLAG